MILDATSWTPAPLRIDRLRAGCVVLLDGKFYQVERMAVEESLTDGPYLAGPGSPGPSRLQLLLRRALWIDHPDRWRSAPAPPNDILTIPTETLTSPAATLLIDGLAYGLYLHNCSLFGSHDDSVELQLDRLPWNDPKTDAKGGQHP